MGLWASLKVGVKYIPICRVVQRGAPLADTVVQRGSPLADTNLADAETSGAELAELKFAPFSC